MNLWTLKDKEGKLKDKTYCNLYKACKNMNALDIATGLKQNTIDGLETLIEDRLDDESTLITHSGDWGIKKTECKITSSPWYSYTIEDAASGGVYLNLEIDSVASRVERWFTTNIKQPLRENIYPIPINAMENTFDNVNLEQLRSINKSGLCYANFTITSPYRIRVAEWAWKQNYINCNFPKRYNAQDVELNMPILKGEKLPVKEFLTELSSHHFAIAPTGNGLDTFRTWECILCNTVPIVQDSWMNQVFSKIWPMVLVNRYEWTDVRTRMNDFHAEHGKIEYDYSLLLEENFDKLLDRLQYESDRLRWE